MDTHRPIPEFMSELSDEAKRADFAAIVVGYDEQTRFVWSTCENPAARLEALLSAGGKPVAILGADIIGNAFIYRLNPFPEYEEDTRTRQYLSAVGQEVVSILEQRLPAARN